jgi:hypothetical protein
MNKKTDTRRDDTLGAKDTLGRNDTLGSSDPLAGNATRDDLARDKYRRDESKSDADKSPERLEREVDEARARVGRTANGPRYFPQMSASSRQRIVPSRRTWRTVASAPISTIGSMYFRSWSHR